MRVEIKRVFHYDDGAEIEMRPSVEQLLTDIISRNSNPKIALLKFLRAEYGMTLRNAKETTDHFIPTDLGDQTDLGELLRSKIHNDCR